MSEQLVVGDWVQAGEEISDEGVVVAPKGALGHVVEEPDGAGWPTVYFESTGRTTICHPDEVTFLGHSDTGRAEQTSVPTIPGTMFPKRKKAS